MVKIVSFSPVKCFYKKFNRIDNNQLVASKEINLGFVEIVFWSGFYEIFLRPRKKRYGYFLKTFSKLNQALNFLENIELVDIEKLLPNEISSFSALNKPKIFNRYK